VAKAKHTFWGISVSSTELLHLDALRFIASVSIVLDHSFEFFFTEALRPSIHKHVNGLGMFVDLFFAISGFVIAYVYQTRIATFSQIGKFFQRRFARLIPLHWLTFLITILAMAFILFGAHKHLNHPPSFAPAILIETFLLLQAIISPNALAMNGVTWSVSAELVMYAIFPLLAWVAIRSKFAIAISWAVAVSLIMALYGTVWFPDAAWGAVYPPLRALPSFLFGLTLFNYRNLTIKLPRPRIGFVFSIIVFILVALSSAPDIVRLLLAYVVVVYAVAADAEQKSNRQLFAMAALGQLTYSIYMWHMVIVTLLLNSLGDKLLHLIGLPMVLMGIFCYAALGFVSYWSYKYYETPVRRKLDRWKIAAS
jgi:peptidoglycan/LPS O-acetylase OafA/YrhL